METPSQDTALTEVEVIRIDDWLFYPDLLQLEFDNTQVRLEPKAARLLRYFALHANLPLGREVLIENVWPDTVVGDEVLTNAVNKIRRAFRENDIDPNLIETIPKVGYRLVARVNFASVSPLDETPVGSELSTGNLSSRALTPSLGLVAFVILSAGIYFLRDSSELAGNDDSPQIEIDTSVIVEPPTIKPRITLDCDFCPEMVTIEPGNFVMGLDEFPADPDESPAHNITIDYRFELGKYEVTFDEWNACIDGGGCGSYRPNDEGWGLGRQPVLNVSWHDARAYIEWLRQRTGKAYRLPTEAEWEYAARAGSDTFYPWGNSIDAGKANFGNFRARTLQVGSYGANSFDLHDMIGNVWEWVEDCYARNAYSTHRNYPAAFSGEAESCRRVLRGGAWDVDTSDGVHLQRVSVREKAYPDGRYSNYGFRIARDHD